MNPDQLNERIETALRELTRRGTRISITAVAAAAGIPRSSLYRNDQARALVHQRIADTKQANARDPAAETKRLAALLEALGTQVRNHEERIRALEGRPHTMHHHNTND